MNVKTNYKSPAERQPGAKWMTNNFGEIEIIGKIDDGTGRNYLIKFLNTGSEIIASGSRFRTGDIKDNMAKTVCDDWLNFQNFCKDIETLKNYDVWKNDSSFAIDKDGLIEGNKIYCKEACQFIYCGDNTTLSNKAVSIYQGISPTNEIFYFRNQRIFAENYNLTRKGVSAVISGTQSTHRDWKFKRLSKEEIDLLNPELIQD